MNVFLRPLSMTDAPILAKLADNIKIWNNLRNRLPHPYKLSDAESFIDSTIKELRSKTLAVIENEKLCGVIGLEIQEDVYRKSAELGYWIGEPYWGRGIATAAVSKMLDIGFKECKLERIFAATFEHNKASMKVLEKNGFVKEGLAKKAVFKNDTFFDEHRFAILRSEWEINVT